jgi:ribonuclease III
MSKTSISKIEKLLLQKYSEKNLAELEMAIGYTFKDKLFFVKSLSHPSLKQHHNFKLYFLTQKYDFEKLELLGDSVLGLVVIELLINEYPKLAEGTLAKFRNYLVSKKILSKIALEINLQDFIIITEGEKKSGGKTNLANLENAFEALLAAIYLEAGVEVVKIIMQKLWKKYFADMNTLVLDPKSSLQELSHIMSLGLPKYEVLEQRGPVNSPMFNVRVCLNNNIASDGFGKSKKEAEINAAKKLLTLLSN